jgi:hypothetical protein
VAGFSAARFCGERCWKPLSNGRRASFASARRETTEERARRIVLEELQRLGWNETDLNRRRKGDAQKVEIALRLRTETSIPLKWIAQHLQMGTWNNVANCICRSIQAG